MSFFWFVIVVLFVLLCAWVIVVYTGEKNPIDDSNRPLKPGTTPFSASA
jgi:cbb3-type cytochrome oxidase subunit 3